MFRAGPLGVSALARPAGTLGFLHGPGSSDPYAPHEGHAAAGDRLVTDLGSGLG